MMFFDRVGDRGIPALVGRRGARGADQIQAGPDVVTRFTAGLTVADSFRLVRVVLRALLGVVTFLTAGGAAVSRALHRDRLLGKKTRGDLGQGAAPLVVTRGLTE